MKNRMLEEKVLSKFSDCIITKGVKRAIIADITRNKYLFVPLGMVEMLEHYIGFSKEKILKKYEEKELPIIKEYLNYLDDNEIIYWCDEKEVSCFPPIDLNWKYHAKISNAVLDFTSKSQYGIKEVITELNNLNCQHIQIRSYSFQPLNFWQDCLSVLEESEVKGVEIITKWDESFSDTAINIFIENNPRVHSIVFHASNRIEVCDSENHMGSIIYVNEELSNASHCGQIHWNYFNVNIKLFTEAQHHNTCLNRKISIDVNGDIKNCPSMAKSYGNIKDTTLAEAIEKPGFKDLWFINKNKIHVCKDCEFRYICTDCRAYIENPEDIYSKPLKCGYNPYTAEWEEWSTNPLKQKAIEYYGMQELVKKEK